MLYAMLDTRSCIDIQHIQHNVLLRHYLYNSIQLVLVGNNHREQALRIDDGAALTDLS